jgi:hypothetical protein
MEAFMQHQSVAQALREGPISDGQLLLLAMVIDQLAGEDGWTVHTRQDLAEKSRAGCPKTVKRRIVALVKMGYLEERKKPIPGLRLTEKALDHDRAPCPVDWAPCPVDRAPCPIAKCFCLFTFRR